MRSKAAKKYWADKSNITSSFGERNWTEVSVLFDEITSGAIHHGGRLTVKTDEYLYFITNNTDGRGNPSESDDQLYRVGLSELE